MSNGYVTARKILLGDVMSNGLTTHDLLSASIPRLEWLVFSDGC